jgi:hypothetical protein
MIGWIIFWMVLYYVVVVGIVLMWAISLTMYGPRETAKMLLGDPEAEPDHANLRHPML